MMPLPEAFTVDKQTGCRRCGTCCRKGGPSLHLADQDLVSSGEIQLKYLLTLRKGEPVRDNIRGFEYPAATDIIKIRPVSGVDGACVFFVRETTSCTIYSHRPAECRALKCWDTHEIEALYNRERLTRRHLLGQASGLWDLVEEHQSRCDYHLVADLADCIRGDHRNEQAADSLLEIIRYDLALRQVTQERTGWDGALLPFLFGNPLTETIRRFRLQIAAKGEKLSIEPFI